MGAHLGACILKLGAHLGLPCPPLAKVARGTPPPPKLPHVKIWLRRGPAKLAPQRFEPPSPMHSTAYRRPGTRSRCAGTSGLGCPTPHRLQGPGDGADWPAAYTLALGHTYGGQPSDYAGPFGLNTGLFQSPRSSGFSWFELPASERAPEEPNRGGYPTPHRLQAARRWHRLASHTHAGNVWASGY